MNGIYTVKQVNSYIKNMFTQDFMLNRIYVKGEISNCKYHPSGHIYFSLKAYTVNSPNEKRARHSHQCTVRSSCTTCECRDFPSFSGQYYHSSVIFTYRCCCQYHASQCNLIYQLYLLLCICLSSPHRYSYLYNTDNLLSYLMRRICPSTLPYDHLILCQGIFFLMLQD